jgi:hypothetical protein
MKANRRTLLSLPLFACIPLPASAQFGGLLGGGSKPAEGGDIDSQVKSFLDKSVGIESTISRASLAIVSAYAAEEDRAKLQAKYDEVSKSTDPKEAGAKFQAITESAGAEVKKLGASADLADRTSKLSDAKKKLLATGVGNFLLGALQAKDLTPTGQNVLKLAGANPMNIGKVVPVKDALPRLANAGSLAGNTLPQFVKALKGANVQVVEVSSSSKEVNIDGGIQ